MTIRTRFLGQGPRAVVAIMSTVFSLSVRAYNDYIVKADVAAGMKVVHNLKSKATAMSLQGNLEPYALLRLATKGDVQEVAR